MKSNYQTALDYVSEQFQKPPFIEHRLMEIQRLVDMFDDINYIIQKENMSKVDKYDWIKEIVEGYSDCE